MILRVRSCNCSSRQARITSNTTPRIEDWGLKDPGCQSCRWQTWLLVPRSWVDCSKRAHTASKSPSESGAASQVAAPLPMARRLVLPRPSDSESMGMGPAEHRSRDTEQIGLWWIGFKQGCGNHPTGHPCRNNRNEWLVYVIRVVERWRAGQMFPPVVGNTTPRRSIRSSQNGDGRNSRDPVRLATSSRPAQTRPSHGRFCQGNTVSDRYSAETPGWRTLSHLQNPCNCSYSSATLRSPFVMVRSSTLIQDRPHEPLVTRP